MLGQAVAQADGSSTMTSCAAPLIKYMEIRWLVDRNTAAPTASKAAAATTATTTSVTGGSTPA